MVRDSGPVRRPERPSAMPGGMPLEVDPDRLLVALVLLIGARRGPDRQRRQRRRDLGQSRGRAAVRGGHRATSTPSGCEPAVSKLERGPGTGSHPGRGLHRPRHGLRPAWANATTSSSELARADSLTAPDHRRPAPHAGPAAPERARASSRFHAMRDSILSRLRKPTMPDNIYVLVAKADASLRRAATTRTAERSLADASSRSTPTTPTATTCWATWS